MPSTAASRSSSAARARDRNASPTRVRRTSRVVRWSGRFLPRLTYPELADSNGPVELAPALRPSVCDVARARVSEHLPQAFLAARVRVGNELDSVRALDLLEAVGKELDHVCARLFRPRGGNLDRHATRRGQRNALFNLSKNPSSTL